MNLFEKALEIENAAKISSRKGNSSPLIKTLVMPYFKGNMRKAKDEYKEVVKGNAHVTGAFIMNYFSCLACQIVEQENKSLSKGKAKHVLSVYLVAALIQSEGFVESDFSRKHKAHKEISASLIAFAKREKLSITVDADTGEIKGITQKIACSVLNYF